MERGTAYGMTYYKGANFVAGGDSRLLLFCVQCVNKLEKKLVPCAAPLRAAATIAFLWICYHCWKLHICVPDSKVNAIMVVDVQAALGGKIVSFLPFKRIQIYSKVRMENPLLVVRKREKKCVCVSLRLDTYSIYQCTILEYSFSHLHLCTFFSKGIIDYGTTGLVISRTLGGLYFVDLVANSNNNATSVQCSIHLHLHKMHHPMEDYVLMPEMIICCILQRLR
jgi:hypothetical protein